MLLYSLKPNMKRIIIPQALKILSLCVLFYIGIMINVRLLDITVPDNIVILILGVLILLFVMEMVLIYSKYHKLSYTFHDDKIKMEGKNPKSIPYTDILNMNIEENGMDKLFKTSTISLSPKFRIKFINGADKVYVYIQKLIQRKRAM